MLGKTTFVPPAGPPNKMPSREIYKLMGEEHIFQMLEDFYIELAQSEIRHMFPDNPEDLVTASKKSGAFFVGLLGGPPLYHQRYGSPMMRARHLPFPIDQKARDTWLACFETVLENATEKYHFPAKHLPDFKAFLAGFSTWMINTR